MKEKEQEEGKRKGKRMGKRKGRKETMYILIIINFMLSVAKRQSLLPSLECCSPFISLL